MMLLLSAIHGSSPVLSLRHLTLLPSDVLTSLAHNRAQTDTSGEGLFRRLERKPTDLDMIFVLTENSFDASTL